MEFLKISLNPNGSLNRPSHFQISPPTAADEQSSSSVLAISKDVPLNTLNKTSLRLYLPKSPPANNKLPVIVYVHGGGFIITSVATSFTHDACVLRAAKIPALIVSVEYRLAPEHRLPAAYDDAAEALLWVRDQARCVDPVDPWLRDYADFDNCFIMGTSAGGNIAYHLGLRSLNLDLEPLKISGLILNQAYFGGVERTESEARSVDDKNLPLAAIDVMWELALPMGANRDHEYSNPLQLPMIAKAKGLPRCLVKGFVGDPLLDRMRELAKTLEGEGVSVTAMMEDEGYHGIELFEPEKGEAVVAEFRSFIYKQ